MVLQMDSNTTSKPEHKKLPLCPKCKSEVDSRISRGFFVKNLLFFLPLKRYVCYRCQRKRYVLG
jgi:ribosomal protein L37AE/L43A